MADYFDPSPRASKRQRTATYKSQELALEKESKAKSADTSKEKSAGIVRRTSRSRLHEDGVNSALTQESLDDNLLADDTLVQEHGAQAHESPAIRDLNRARGGTSPNKARATSTGSLKRRRKSERKGTELTEDIDLESNANGDGETLALGHQGTDFSDGHLEAVQVQTASRGRKKAHRFMTSPNKPTDPIQTSEDVALKPVIETEKAQERVDTPKGILTPSKTRVRRPSKSVAFSSASKAVEEQLGFKDIDTTVRKTPAKVTVRKVQNAGIQASSSPATTPRRARKNVAGRNSIRLPEGLDTTENGVVEDEDDVFFDQLLAVETDVHLPKSSAVIPTDDFSLLEDSPYLAVKAQVLSRLLRPSYGDPSTFPACLQMPYRSLYDVLTATITTGESNSLLLLGSRGVGKSLLLNTALKDLGDKHPDNFHTIRLNGFIQTDDKLALREIWRQLGREMNVSDDETSKAANYADTMASLLSVLSHPDEFLQSSTDGANTYDHMDAALESTTGSFGTTKISKSVLFVIDEFDLFTTHPRQTLLYNLFDIAQSRKAPIAVIGCSTRMDVVECLEKRVKSRFSHRWLHVSGAKSLEAFEDMIKNALQINDTLGGADKQLAADDVEARKAWNRDVETHLIPSPAVQHLIRRTFYSTKSVPDLLAALYLPVATLSRYSSSSQGTPSYLPTISKHLPSTVAPHLVTLLPSLPTLQLSLLCAAARLDTIHNLSAVNFNLVFDHYVELVARSKLQQTASGAVAVGAGVRQWTRGIAQDAWEDLGSWALVAPALSTTAAAGTGAGAGAGGREFSGAAELVGGEGASVRMWKVDVSLDDLAWALKEKASLHGGIRSGPIEVLSKWCREI